jgi:hypothetical protein
MAYAMGINHKYVLNLPKSIYELLLRLRAIEAVQSHE